MITLSVASRVALQVALSQTTSQTAQKSPRNQDLFQNRSQTLAQTRLSCYNTDTQSDTAEARLRDCNVSHDRPYVSFVAVRYCGSPIEGL